MTLQAITATGTATTITTSTASISAGSRGMPPSTALRWPQAWLMVIVFLSSSSWTVVQAWYLPIRPGRCPGSSLSAAVAAASRGVREPYTRRVMQPDATSTTTTTTTTNPHSHSQRPHHDDYHHRHPSTADETTEWTQSVVRAELDLHHALMTSDLYTLDALWEEGCIMVDPYDRHMDKNDALETHYLGLLPVDHYQVLPSTGAGTTSSTEDEKTVPTDILENAIQIMAVPGRPDVALVIVNIHFVGDIFPGHFVNEYVQYRRVWRRRPAWAELHESQAHHESQSPPQSWWQVMREEASLVVHDCHQQSNLY